MAQVILCNFFFSPDCKQKQEIKIHQIIQIHIYIIINTYKNIKIYMHIYIINTYINTYISIIKKHNFVSSSC